MKSDAVVIHEFFEELDARVAGVSGTHSPDSRQRLAEMRPVLAARAERDPAGFADDLRFQQEAMAAIRRMP